MAETQVLLVEDDVRFAELLSAWLEEGAIPGAGNRLPPTLHLHHVATLADAITWLTEHRPDILLVDLNLPDSQGLTTCDRLLAHETRLPLIVLSGLDDEALAIQAVGRGAQDYLVKSQLDAHLLLRAVRYALERSRLQRELERSRQDQLQQREQETLERLVERGNTPVAARSLGVRTLEHAHPELFARFAGRLATLLEQVLEMRTHKVNHPVSSNLRKLAEELGVLKCGPRDVVALYRAARTLLERPGNTLRNETLHEEGRYLTFELMGHLVSCYRPYALGGEPRSPAPGESTPRHGPSSP